MVRLLEQGRLLDQEHIYNVRSALEPLGKANMNLITNKASLDVKAITSPEYKNFAKECAGMLLGLQTFLEKAHTVCADADTQDASGSDDKLKSLLSDIKKHTTTAEHHKIGANSAFLRYNAILGVSSKS